MLGLLYKDMISSRKFILLAWGLAVAFSTILAFDNDTIMMGVLSMVFLMSYIAILIRFFQAKEKDNTMVLLKTLPISYTLIVASKHLLCFLTAVSSTLLFFLASLFLPGVGIGAWSEASLFFILYLFIIGTSYSAVGIFVSLRFGSSYARVTNALIYILIVFLMSAGIPKYTLVPKVQNVVILSALVITSLVLFLLSVRAIKIRNFLKD